MSAKDFRNVSKWNKKLFYIKSPDAFDRMDDPETGLYTVKFRKCFLDLMLLNESSDVTIIFFHAALTKRSGVKLPIFSGANLAAGINANKIFVSDPSLYLSDSIRLGWFLGSRYFHAEEILTNILVGLLKSLGSKKIILFGASAGGFASILFGGLLLGKVDAEVLSVPVNPQTNILKFSPRPVEEYFRVAWNVKKRSKESLDGIGVTYDFTQPKHLDKFAGLNMLYIQNTKDHHYVSHFLPFLGGLGDDAAQKYILADDFGEGHVSPPLSYLKGLLGKVVDSGLSGRHLKRKYNVKEFLNYEPMVVS
ncbi:hypothetical protein [uncultured Microbulbifer sp.]|uniref:hypothetical protein n=1 Tax=uncultured Microbulbifer sp. TaxID=348147 RepID=UPI002607E74C|nr:hypothetical protein [uncultured Microbulbifer sp.]